MRKLAQRMAVFGARGLLIGAMLALGAAHAQPHADEPQQVNVSVKILEFQTTLGVETGFSAYFQQREVMRPYGRVSSGRGSISSADITFPIRSSAAITVFLDRITTHYGDIEAVIQALVDENRAFILSRPRAMVRVGAETPTQVKTVREVPYEDTVVVGNTAVQITKFRDTGVTLNLSVPEVTDDDGDWTTNDDSYIKLDVHAEVKELGQRIVVALDDRFQQANDVSLAQDKIQAPEFISRSIDTSVWVRHGQVLALGGLFRNTKAKRLDTLPWLTQAEDVAVGLADRAIPGNLPSAPVSSALGSRTTEEGRRELVFLIRAEIWRPAFTVANEHGFMDVEPESRRGSPTDVIRDVVEGITDIPQGIADGIIRRDGDTIESQLGGRD